MLIIVVTDVYKISQVDKVRHLRQNKCYIIFVINYIIPTFGNVGEVVKSFINYRRSNTNNYSHRLISL
jgi:hypothetical protein